MTHQDTVAKNGRPTFPKRGVAQIKTPSLWQLVWGQPYIDAARMATAIERELQVAYRLDFRTRLLLRDALKAMSAFRGPRKFARWVAESPVRVKIKAILQEDLGKPGYSNIKDRLVFGITKNQIEQVFELLGRNVDTRVEVNIAGSIPTLIKGLTVSPTDDIAFVDEVPAEIRSQRKVIDQIKAKFGITLGHVQSHYLPFHWLNRRQFLGDFGDH